MMRSYRPMRIGAITDPQMRRELQATDDWLRQLSANQSRLVQMPIGTPSAVTNPPSQGIDVGAYLYLPGRSHEQMSLGPVSFDAFGVAYGDSAPTTERTFLWKAQTNDGSAQPARIFIGAQGSRAGATASAQKRYWAFPSFTDINTGPSVGLHYFVDADDYQALSKKTINNDCYLKIEDTVAGAGIINAARTSILQLAWGSGYPAGGGSAATPTTITGVVPSLMIPGLDYKDSGVGARDRTHVWCVLKSDHTDTTPFEPGTPLFGSSSGKELYSMFGTAQGTLAAPTTGSLPIWRATVTQSCTFTLSSAIVTMASTTGIAMGMRMRETLNAYALPENTHVKSVDSPTQVTMSAVWPASNLTRTIDFFGMTWSDTATGLSLSHSSLSGLTNDDHPQYLLLVGRTNGQKIGTASQNGSTDDIVTSGRVNIGTAAFSANQKLTVSESITAVVGTVNQARITPSIGASGTSTATYRALLCQVTGGGSLTGGTPSFHGAALIVSPVVGNGCSPNEAIGLDMSAQCGVSGISTVGETSGLRGSGRGQASLVGDRISHTSINGVSAKATAIGANCSTMNAVKCDMDTLNMHSGVATRACGLNIDTFGVTGQFSGATTTADTVNTSPTLNNVVAVTNFATGMYITGAGIPASTFVLSVNVGASQVTLTNNATATATGVTITYAGAITTWSGIYRSFGAVANMRKSRFIDNQSDIQSLHVGKIYVNPPTPTNYPNATAGFHLGAGTAAAGSSPLKIDNGTVMTVAEAGAAEYDGAKFYLTHSDAVRTMIVTQRGVVDATAQAAAIGVTTLYTPPAAGYYVIHYTLEDTTADVTAGTIQFQVSYTDDIGATNQTGAALALTVVGRDRGSFQVYSASGAITYQTNLVGIVGTARYVLRVRLEFLG